MNERMPSETEIKCGQKLSKIKKRRIVKKYQRNEFECIECVFFFRSTKQKWLRCSMHVGQN
jgi:hypothetical protein